MGFLSGKYALICGAAAISLIAATPVMAQQRTFNVPAQPANKSIPEFARQAGIQIVASGGVLRGIRTGAIRGQLDVEAALAQMLRGTGLEIISRAGNTIIIGKRRAAKAADDLPAPVEAQASVEAQEAIIVTGSRIPKAGFETLQAANTIGGDLIDKVGQNNIAEAINQLPAFGTPTSGAGGQNPQTVGQNFVNAFGLGTARTLTLVNGRRVVSQASPGNAVDPGQQVDLNIIPSIMIDRVEAIYTGGAPIYGADAIAGTVNVILKEKFEGIRLDGQAGISSRGDAFNYRVGAIAGTEFSDGRGRVVVAGEYNRIDGLPGVARKRISTGYNYCNNTANTGPADGIPDQIICEDAEGLSLVPLTGGPSPRSGNYYATNPLSNAFVRNGEPLVFSLDGRSLLRASEARLGTPVSASATRGADGANNPYIVSQPETNSLISPVSRYSAAGQASYDLTDNVTAYAEGLYAHTKATDEYSQGGFSSALFPANGGQIRVRLDNPFLAPAVRDEIAAASPPGIDTNGDGVADTPGFFLARYNGDILQGSPMFRTQDVYRFVGGLKGDFAVGDRDWHWDISYNYGRTRAKVNARSINLTRFGLALDTVSDGAGGAVCRVSLDPNAASGIGAARPTAVTAADISGCVPFNPMGYATSPDMDGLRSYLVQDVVARSRLQQQVVEATLGGKPFSLPAGDVDFAIGLTYRHERARYDGMQPNLGYYVGDTIGAISGSYHTKEAYAEAVIPLLSALEGFSLPVVRELTFEGAARIVDNSYSGSDWTWTAGGRLGLDLPLIGDAITVRGNVTHAVRAPAFAELLTPPTAVTGLGNDPCDQRFINSGASSGNRAASCAAEVASLKAAGTLPAGFALGNFTSQVVNVAVPGVQSGNPALENERSKSWTLGVVIAPSSIPGLRVSIDWTDVKINGAIVSASLSQLFATCYDNGTFGSDAACGRFTRDPVTFQVTGFKRGFINAAQRRFSGLLVDAQYSFLLDALSVPGRLTLGGTGFYTDRHEQTINRGDLDIFDGERGFERYRAQGNVQLDLDSFSALWQTIYTSGGVVDRQARPELRDPGDFGAFWTHNLSLTFRPAQNYELRFIVRNLFDATDDERRIAAKTTNSVVGGGNLLMNQVGRSFLVGAKLSF